jgi:hypothetical protein
MPVVNATDFPNDKNWVKEWEGAAAAFVAGNGKNDLLVVEPKAGNMIGLSIMLHEVQHAIQAYEGYFAGALISPNRDPLENRAMHYACPQEREAYNVESRFCGGKKKWFEEENPMFAGYPKRLGTSQWKPRMLAQLEAFLRRDGQRAIFRQTLAVRARILAAAVA